MPKQESNEERQARDTLAPQSPSPLKSYQQILREEVNQAEEELHRPAHGLMVSGTLAGIGMGFSVLLIAAGLTMSEGAGEMSRRLLLANAYAVGFVLVILGRTDLFTEYTTIAILPVLVGKSKLRSLARLWGLVYLGNLLGSVAFAALLATMAPALGVATAESFGRIAADLVRPEAWVMVTSAILAGWLMGLLSWLITAARDTISQIVFVWLVAGTIGLGNLHHSIVGAVEMFAGFFATDAVKLIDCLRFLLLVTCGNAIGGAIFAVLIRYSVVVGKAR